MPQNKAACCSLFLAFAGEFGVKRCTVRNFNPPPPAAQGETPRSGSPINPFQALFPADRAGLRGSTLLYFECACRVCPGGTSDIRSPRRLPSYEDKPRQGGGRSTGSGPERSSKGNRARSFHRPCRDLAAFSCISGGWHHRLTSVMPPIFARLRRGRPASRNHSISGSEFMTRSNPRRCSPPLAAVRPQNWDTTGVCDGLS